ncbi:hypothetical protein [Devosia sp.]|uniref:hypothetical protein n=1 Tax=Devosia sp. TaxID=1871048 RepID=UPI0032660EA8
MGDVRRYGAKVFSSMTSVVSPGYAAEVNPSFFSNWIAAYVSRQMPGTLSRVHDMILAKEIWVGRLAGSEKPYSSILIRADQVKAVIAPDSLDTWQVAKAAGLRYRLVKEMVAAGHLVSEVSMNPAGRLARRTFDQSEVDKVRSSFTDLTSLAKKSGHRASAVLTKLEAAGVEPIRAVKDGKVILRLHRLEDLQEVSL